jgi:hypothetical protein
MPSNWRKQAARHQKIISTRTNASVPQRLNGRSSGARPPERQILSFYRFFQSGDSFGKYFSEPVKCMTSMIFGVRDKSA